MLRWWLMEYSACRKYLEDSKALLIGAGAGMGVDSGLPDFRGTEGFWKAYPLLKDLNLSFTDMASPAAFEENPHRAWAFYGHRLNLYRATQPHAGFSILLDIAERLDLDVFVFTSNVDGHFQKAGFSEEQVYECHGSIHHFQCVDGACQSGIFPAIKGEIAIDAVNFLAHEPLPNCPACAGLARPAILMFGDWNWNASRSDAQQMRYRQWASRYRDDEVTVVEFGAGTAIPTVRNQCEPFSKLIRVNPRESDGPRGVLSFPVGALEFCEKLSAAVEQGTAGP